MSSLSPDSTVSHYKIKQLLGRGGMGEVYKAVDLKLGRMVALKTLLPSLSSDQTAYQRFLREARSASVLTHPGICTVFEVGQHGDLVYIAMQYIEGKSINQILSQGRLPIETALAYAIEIADALEEAHRLGILHRDIKPSNIIVSERGHAVVLDFGLAKQFALLGSAIEEAPTQLQLTSETTIVGTVPYMSPEQVRRESLDGRSDIFSFGVLLYEMLTGVSPFNRPQTIDILHAVLHENPRPVSEVRPQVGRAVDRIVQKALAKDRKDRYQYLAEMKADLLKVIEKKRYKVRGVATGPAQNRQTDEGALNKTALAAATATRRLTSTIKKFISSLSWKPVAITLAAVALVAAAWWSLNKSSGGFDSDLIGSLKYEQIINWKDQGGVLQNTYGVLSRDGKMIAYRSRAGAKGSIWIKQIKEGDPVQVVNDDWNNLSPIWSPDDQEIAFISTRGNKRGIWRIPAFGGTPKPITALETPDAQSIQLTHWSRDGMTIYYRTDKDLFRLDIATGEATQITNFNPSDQIVRHFAISHDEDRIAYIHMRENQFDIWVIPMAGGQPQQITNDKEEDFFPVWHPDGKRIVYSSKRDGIFQLCVANVNGNKPTQITFGENDSFVSDVSSDGTKILYSGLREESDIWAVDIKTGEEAQITSDVAAELWSDISPDGKSIAFQSVRQWSQASNIDSSAIFNKSLDAEGRQIQLALGAMSPKWSPDGQTIAFVRTSSLVTDIWSVSAVGGNETRVTNRGISGLAFSTLPYNRFNPNIFSWSPDSSRISYCSEIPEIGIWVSSADGQRDMKVVSATDENTQLSSPCWSPDGSRIAYLSRIEGEKTIWSVGVVDQKTRGFKTVYQTSSVLRLFGWSLSGNTVFVATIEDRPNVWPSPAEVKFFQVSVEKSDRRLLAATHLTYLYNTQLSPDGRIIGIVARQDGKDNIWLVPTDGGEIKRITVNTDPRLYLSAITWSPDTKRIYFDKQSRYSLIYMINNFK